MAITTKQYGDNYDENSSRIVAMNQVLKNYQSDFNMVKRAEMYYEQMRTLNKTTLVQIDVTKSIGNIVSSLSIGNVWESPGESAIDAALAEARSTVLARAVGPLEDLPVGDYVQDSVRMKNVITHTQIGPEHRLIAKLVQMKGNKLNPQNSPGGNAVSYLTTDDNGFILSKSVPISDVPSTAELTSARRNADNALLNFAETTNEDGTKKDLRNFWSRQLPYSQSWAEDIADETFNFAIFNQANNIRKSFPAYIRDLNEAASTSWNSISLINRSEDIYIYQRAERNFNLEFYIFASTMDEVKEYPDENQFPTVINITSGATIVEVGVMSKKMMWDRINFLHSLTRPTYTSDGHYDRAPYCRLFIGGLFQGINAIIDSVNISYDPLLWDINVDPTGDGVKPMVALITLSGKFIHSIAPSANHDFYGRTT